MSDDHERKAYAAQHKAAIEEALGQALNATIKILAPDPVAELAKQVSKLAHSRATITAAHGGPGPESNQWTTAAWLASIGIADQLARAIHGSMPENELAATRELGSCVQLEELLRTRFASGIDTIVDALAPRLRELAQADAHKSDEPMGKFSQARDAPPCQCPLAPFGHIATLLSSGCAYALLWLA